MHLNIYHSETMSKIHITCGEIKDDKMTLTVHVDSSLVKYISDILTILNRGF